MTDRNASLGKAEKLAEDFRELTAFKYAGDCKCGKCQLVPRELIDRVIAHLRAPSFNDGVEAAAKVAEEFGYSEVGEIASAIRSLSHEVGSEKS